MFMVSARLKVARLATISLAGAGAGIGTVFSGLMKCVSRNTSLIYQSFSIKNKKIASHDVNFLSFMPILMFIKKSAVKICTVMRDSLEGVRYGLNKAISKIRGKKKIDDPIQKDLPPVMGKNSQPLEKSGFIGKHGIVGGVSGNGPAQSSNNNSVESKISQGPMLQPVEERSLVVYSGNRPSVVSNPNSLSSPAVVGRNTSGPRPSSSGSQLMIKTSSNNGVAAPAPSLNPVANIPSTPPSFSPNGALTASRFTNCPSKGIIAWLKDATLAREAKMGAVAEMFSAFKSSPFVGTKGAITEVLMGRDTLSKKFALAHYRARTGKTRATIESLEAQTLQDEYSQLCQSAAAKCQTLQSEKPLISARIKGGSGSVTDYELMFKYFRFYDHRRTLFPAVSNNDSGLWYITFSKTVESRLDLRFETHLVLKKLEFIRLVIDNKRGEGLNDSDIEVLQRAAFGYLKTLRDLSQETTRMSFLPDSYTLCCPAKGLVVIPEEDFIQLYEANAIILEDRAYSIDSFLFKLSDFNHEYVLDLCNIKPNLRASELNSNERKEEIQNCLEIFDINFLFETNFEFPLFYSSLIICAVSSFLYFIKRKYKN